VARPTSTTRLGDAAAQSIQAVRLVLLGRRRPTSRAACGGVKW